MTLTDPRDALAEQSSFISYLVGLAGLARVVHALAADGDRRVDPPAMPTTSSTCCSASRAWEMRSSDSPNPHRPSGIRQPRLRRPASTNGGGCDDRGART